MTTTNEQATAVPEAAAAAAAAAAAVSGTPTEYQRMSAYEKARVRAEVERYAIVPVRRVCPVCGAANEPVAQIVRDKWRCLSCGGEGQPRMMRPKTVIYDDGYAQDFTSVDLRVASEGLGKALHDAQKAGYSHPDKPRQPAWGTN